MSNHECHKSGSQTAAHGYVSQWSQRFRESPPRRKPGSFNLERVMEAVTQPQGGGK